MQMDPESQKKQEEEKKKKEEARGNILRQILTQEARERLGTIALVKPEKAAKIEDMIIQAAQMGKIVNKVSEEQLKQMLEQLSGTVQETKVKIVRKENQEDNFDEIENEFY